MAADKGKKSKIERPEDDESDLIDGDLVLSIEKLQEVQDELEKVNEEASDKVLEVEQKYNEIRRPVYVKRTEIIKDIPQFWSTALTSHPVISDILSEEDHKIFKYLQSIDVEDFKDLKSGYSISFLFSPNPHFEDTKLTKTFSFSDEGVTKIEGTTIKWKEGSGLANGDNQEKKGNKRPFADNSFFNWFSETNYNDLAEGVSDEIAEMIKDDLWPNPLRYFNNEADEDFEEDEQEEGKGIDGVDEEEDDEDDEDDDDDDAEDGED